MDVTRFAAWCAVVGVIVVSVGVGFYDWRAGLIVFGLFSTAAGIWTLKE